ncbi:uncharacterized protein TRIADDRAFT_56937 [Trichoplax adhaerens]|uniref:NTR domain-containing protein n=1 Tax=Trichoplax adhaerens TaxID=10228 RepID=B3RWZ3_TRIAD|nr:hypothetical protein TRIADDRAFT_56937 [Trichoplax adhaerens]EDV25219.1 hypothetical protein TRIADDRAFT_56937 [Trichoplax adhaerens]|eukprot:XP_002113109.1 hypothetical protein TRIADDRAFT_56937 [Trichoplax adhaerens]
MAFSTNFMCPALILVAATVVTCLNANKSCKYQHPQTLFCLSDFAIKARIISMGKITVTNDIANPIQITSYKIHVKKFFLDRSNSIGFDMWQKNVKLQVEQSLVASKSAITLQPKSTYVIFGSFSQDRKHLILKQCGFYAPWHNITREQRFGLRHAYNDNCHRCNIKLCHNVENNKDKKKLCTANKNECLWKPKVMAFSHCPLNSSVVISTDCHALHSTCAYHSSNQRCTWIYSKSVRKCKMEYDRDLHRSRSPYKYHCK